MGWRASWAIGIRLRKLRSVAMQWGLGALAEASSQVLTLYLPDKDKKGREVPAHDTWVKDALGLMARISAGTTCLWGEGSWKNKPEDEPTLRAVAGKAVTPPARKFGASFQPLAAH